MTQEFPKNNSYMIHPFPCHTILFLCADYSIAINTTNYTGRQQFSAETVSPKPGLLRKGKRLCSSKNYL